MTDYPSSSFGDDTRPDIVAASNGHTLVLEAGLPRGYDDDELTAAELADDSGCDPSDEPHAPSSGLEDELAAMQARMEALARATAQREGSRVRRKVGASAIGAAIASAAPVILQAVDTLNLPEALQPFSIAITAVIGAFVAGYVTPEREIPQV